MTRLLVDVAEVRTDLLASSDTAQTRDRLVSNFLRAMYLLTTLLTCSDGLPTRFPDILLSHHNNGNNTIIPQKT